MKRTELQELLKERGVVLPRRLRRAAWKGMRNKKAIDFRPSQRLDISAMGCGYCDQPMSTHADGKCPTGVVNGVGFTVGSGR